MYMIKLTVKIRSFLDVFGDIPYEIMSDKFPSSLTVPPYIRLLKTLTNETTAVHVCSNYNASRFGRLVNDWLVIGDAVRC